MSATLVTWIDYQTGLPYTFNKADDAAGADTIQDTAIANLESRVEALETASVPASSIEPFIHPQSIASTVWTCNHGLGRKPVAIRILANNTEVAIGEILDLGVNTTQITFLSAIAGSALFI